MEINVPQIIIIETTKTRMMLRFFFKNSAGEVVHVDSKSIHEAWILLREAIGDSSDYQPAGSELIR